MNISHPKPRVLTGLRANNDLTLGNYLGALLPIIDMAKAKAGEYDVNLFVPDLHSFTTPIDHTQLQAQIMQNLRVFVAVGLPIDNKDVYIYRQSYVPAHSELTWILDCFTGFGEMRRMTQFKDKTNGLLNYEDAEYILQNPNLYSSSEQQRAIKTLDELLGGVGAVDGAPDKIHDLKIKKIKELPRVSLGLFNYPVLMAADILLYNAQYVPVGDDQSQHLEFTRDVSGLMNRKFGNLFIIPKSVSEQHAFFGKDQGLRIKDLIDPTKKMSKSDESGRGVIFMSDTPEAAAKKVMSATTDSFGEIQYDPKERPGISNLLQILALLSNRNLQEVIAEHQGKTSYGDFKKEVAGVVCDFLTDFHAKLEQVNDEAIISKLEYSEDAMNKVAKDTLLRVQRAVGLRA